MKTKQVGELAKMLRLELSESEVEALAGDLDSILNSFSDLESTDIGQISEEPPSERPLREDFPIDSAIHTQCAALAGERFDRNSGEFILQKVLKK